MNILQIGILVFSVIETLNILVLYRAPGMKIGNSVGVFKTWGKLQENEEFKQFAHYMVYWVAGAKLIFILVGIVVVIWGNIETQLATCAAMVISIASFFYKLYPIIKDMDKKGLIEPKGYSKTLLLMIVAFIIGFVIVFTVGLIQYL